MEAPDIELPDAFEWVYDPEVGWMTDFSNLPPVFLWNVRPQLLGLTPDSLRSIESLSVMENLLLHVDKSFREHLSQEIIEEADFWMYTEGLAETRCMLARLQELRLLANTHAMQ